MVGLPMLEKNAKAEAICESDKTDKLKELIADFKSDSNDTRSDAKSISERCIDGPNRAVFANKLYHVLSLSQDHNSCTILAILLRKSLINQFDTPFLRFPAETRSTLKRGLLQLLVDTSVDTPTRPINKELCHTVSALAASLLPKKEWPEFLPFLFQLIASDKKRALLIGAHLAQYLGKGLKELHSVNLNKFHSVILNKLYSVILNKLHPVILNKLHPVNLHSVLLQCLKTMTEGEGENVRIAVWGAAINFILSLEQKDLVNFQDLLAAMMSTLKNALYSGNETMADAAVNTLKLLINLAGMKPTFLRKQIAEMVKTILLMADDDSLKKGTRRLAIEFVLTLVQFVLTLAEVEKTNPRLLKIGMEFEINMEEMWDDNKETDNYGSWQGCVDGLSILCDRNDILTVALEVLPHAALIALSKSIIKCFLKKKEWDVRVAALGAAINVIPCLMLTSMMSTVEDVLKDRDEVMAGEVLKLLMELGEPRLLKGQIMECANRMLQIANNDSLNLETRRLVILFLSKLAQVEEIAPWLQQNVRELFEILMNMLDYINDDDPRANDVSAWESTNHQRWNTCLDKLFIAVGKNDMFSVVLEVILAYLDAPRWQKKYSAFFVLTQIIKSCREVMRTNFEPVMPKLLSLFQDDNPVVQNKSIRAIQMLASTLGEHLPVRCDLALPALAEVMNDSPNQDMRGSAASIILDLSQYCTEDNLKEHLEGSIRSCLIVSKEVKEFVTRIRFTEWEMPSLHDMRWWQRNLSTAWLLLWRNEERDFSPYLEILMLPVFRAAQRDLDVTRYDRVIIEEKAMACHTLCFCVDELTDLLVPEIGRVVDTLIPFLKWYHDPPLADALVPPPECYYAKAIRIAATLIPFLKWYQHPPVADALVLPLECYYAKAIRIAAASAMPKILNSVRSVVKRSDPEAFDGLKQYFEKLSEKVLKALEEALDVEPDGKVRYDILYALNDCVR